MIAEKCKLAVIIFVLFMYGLFIPTAYAESTQKTQEAYPEMPEGMTMHRYSAGVADASGWYKAISSKGNFEVSLPVKFNDWSYQPKENPQKIFHYVGGVSSEGVKFLISELPNLRELAMDDIKIFTQNFRDKITGRTTAERYFAYQNYPASEIHKAGLKTNAIFRHILVKDRVFQLTVEYPPKHEALVFQVAPKCFESLIIKLDMAKPSPKK